MKISYFIYVAVLYFTKVEYPILEVDKIANMEVYVILRAMIFQNESYLVWKSEKNIKEKQLSDSKVDKTKNMSLRTTRS